MEISWHPTPYNDNLWDYEKGWRTHDVTNLRVLAKIMLDYCWSPIVWSDGVRSTKNFLFSDLIVIDNDDGEIGLNDAVDNLFCDSMHVIGTTENHLKEKTSGKTIKPACDRFRVVLIPKRRIADLSTYQYNVEYYADSYYGDHQVKDGARMFKPCRRIVSGNIDDDSFKQVVKRPPQDYLVNTDEEYNEDFVIRTLGDFFPEGRKNTTCYQLGREAAKGGIPFEKMVAMILASPSYKSIEIPWKLENEIQTAVKNGIKFRR